MIFQRNILLLVGAAGLARVVGYLCTTWGKARTVDITEWPPITEVLTEWKTQQ